MQHYFVNIVNSKICFTKQDEHHILRVMRMRVNDEIIAIFNKKEYLCEIISLNPLDVTIKEELNTNNEFDKNITLFFALAKGDKIDLVIQKATELGVSKIVLIQTKNCVTKFDNEDFKRKVDRYYLIAKEASEQSHRQLIPEILGVYSLNNIPSDLLCDINFLAYEKCESSETLDIGDANSVSIMIGPEGGFDIKEVELLKQIGFKLVSLGKRILRTETAAISALSVIGYLIEK